MTQPSYTYAENPLLQKAIEALKALPLHFFEDKMNEADPGDMSKCDAADFVDHAGAFFKAMELAKEVLKEAK